MKKLLSPLFKQQQKILYFLWIYTFFLTAVCVVFSLLQLDEKMTEATVPSLQAH